MHAALRQELEDLEAAAVQQARDRRVRAGAIARELNISSDRLRERWSQAAVQRRLSRRTARPTRPPARPQSADEAVRQLAGALSELHRRSGAPIRTLAHTSNVSPSYVSRVLAGERGPSWRVTRALVEACGAHGHLPDIRALWAASRKAPVPTQVDRQVFTQALRGLHLSAGWPAASTVQSVSGGRLSSADLSALLNTQRSLPSWPVVHAYVRAVGGEVSRIHALWQAAYPYENESAARGEPTWT